MYVAQKNPRSIPFSIIKGFRWCRVGDESSEGMGGKRHIHQKSFRGNSRRRKEKVFRRWRGDPIDKKSKRRHLETETGLSPVSTLSVVAAMNMLVCDFFFSIAEYIEHFERAVVASI
mgnify:CR=1 FL=1